LYYNVSSRLESYKRLVSVSSRNFNVSSRSRLGWWSQRLGLGRWATERLGLELLCLVPIPGYDNVSVTGNRRTAQVGCRLGRGDSEMGMSANERGIWWHGTSGMQHLRHSVITCTTLQWLWTRCSHSFVHTHFEPYPGSLPGTGHLSRHVTSHPCQLSLAIPSWVGAMSTSQRAVTPCGWGRKAGMIRVLVAGKTVWSPCYRRPISERLSSGASP